MSTEVLGPRLRVWRHRHDLTLKDIGQSIGVSEATVSDWERGSRFPSRNNMDILAEYMEIPVCALFCDEKKCGYFKG